MYDSTISHFDLARIPRELACECLAGSSGAARVVELLS
jgi:hypothetical protein